MGKSKKIRRLTEKNQSVSNKQEEILLAYEMFDDNDISTERLLAMVADHSGCEIDDIVEALYLQSLQSKNSKR